MAGLPRDPRQKMINVMYLVLTAILALNVSHEVIDAFKVVNTSLITSNDNISASNNTLFKSLEDKLNEPASREKAEIWAPRAMKAKTLSDNLNNYIDGLKTQLLKAADLRMIYDSKTHDSVQDYNEDNLDASTRIFETFGKGEDLRKKLDQYKADMLNIGLPEDSSIKHQFENIFPVNTTPPPSQDGTKKDFTQTFFHMTPTVAALTILSKFQNNIKNAENMVVTFCHSQIGKVEVHMDQVGVLVGQSSNYLMPGQQLTVTAGVGAYSSSVKSNISINGTPINLVSGQGQYTTTVSGAGTHTVQITGSFIGEDGKPVPISQTVNYVVGTPGGAAVMLDKMNVFYIGVPNPVTINSGTGWDKTHVSIEGGDGSISPTGAPGKFDVNVKTVGNASITVSANGKNSTFPFRVKTIPDPVIKVGPSGGGRIQSVIFKNQNFVRADLENFDFDAHFNIVSATIYFSGANFSNVQSAEIHGGSLEGIKSLLQRCIPGTSVTFDNVKVQGPDGKVRNITGPGFILF
ncbi:MAG TPA: gliding motility protein GldM [Hanamia sp.]|nr:gliding motility protein GldM [Hanamia sp.]